jgi:hypothetical protein
MLSHNQIDTANFSQVFVGKKVKRFTPAGQPVETTVILAREYQLVSRANTTEFVREMMRLEPGIRFVQADMASVNLLSENDVTPYYCFCALHALRRIIWNLCRKRYKLHRVDGHEVVFRLVFFLFFSSPHPLSYGAFFHSFNDSWERVARDLYLDFEELSGAISLHPFGKKAYKVVMRDILHFFTSGASAELLEIAVALRENGERMGQIRHAGDGGEVALSQVIFFANFLEAFRQTFVTPHSINLEHLRVVQQILNGEKFYCFLFHRN